MKNLLRIVLALVLLNVSLNAQVITPFTPVYQTTQKGGIIYLANSAIGCFANPTSTAAAASCTAGVDEFPPSGSYKDNDFAATFIDIDGDGSTFMSSSDSLNLPLCSQVTKAYLFWGASATGTAAATYTSCLVKVGTGSYQTVNASYSQTNTTGFNTYHCSADITSLLQSGGIKSRVTVANIGSNEVGNFNRFGSWCIAVVYKNDLLTMRQLTLFRGLGNVSGTSTVNIPISGFLTPLTGPVTLELGMYVHDGDRSLTGDGMSFKGASSFVSVTDAVNTSTDVMNSTVSYNGTLTPFRIPDMNNTGGLDADIFLPNNTAKNYIGNSANSATFQLTTSSETYLPQMISTAIDVYEPDCRAAVRVRDVNGGVVAPGDILEYSIKGLNIGSDPSVNTFMTDTLDLRAEYIPNSTRITYGPGTGTLTDASGDDRLDYNSTTKVLKIRIGSGANAAIGGTVQNSTTGIDSTVVTYSVLVTSSCVKISCSPTIQARAYIWGTGAVSSNTFNNGSNPGIFDGNGCPIPGTTSSPITATVCSLASATVTSPGCIGGSVILSAPIDTEPSITYNWAGPLSFASTSANNTLTPVTSGMAGVYSVTLAIPSSTCKGVKTTTLVTTVCTPTAVNDATNTVQNTPVSGNASTNDLNVSSSTYSLTGQPANGTVTMNASGQYTFVPSPTFTGVTTSTYSACNGTNCSNATISFTVFPTLSANPDIINTTPSVTATGSLLSNDGGINPSLGGTYSVTVTQPSAATGTITVNPATGQYTFIPNPAFVGSVQTTYTVCNTAVNPTFCSNSTITINVFPNPAPVNDATTTVIGTSVVASAATNDGGTSGGTFSITNQPANGTVTINPTTGQYTFVPSPTFTGVTTATYNLCNGAPSSCSNAVISVTVFPNLTANPDVVNTTPSVAVSGTLTGNDAGFTPTLGGTYSVTVTQPSAATGTFAINPATGQYTFTPNPAFVGSVQTTYTICNTAVNPQQCSNTTITINVKPNPAPVNDATTTVIGTSVVASAATNDGGTSGGTFSITNQPANGTVTINPTTGQYTFVPSPTFTGVTTATYNLCNGAPSSCSNAVISVTVFPNLTANPDVVNTTPSVAVSGTLTGNDAGFTPTLGGTYSVTVTQPSAATGTFAINPATGQYTFTPNPVFVGSVQTTYTICNTAVNPQQCSNTTITINVKPNPAPVNDATTTVIGTSVTANAATNDGGTSGGTFSITGQPSGGTVTINPSTGQYTFVPSPTFTGVTTATYNLCNGAPSTCSTAIITITVYPALVANQDVIVTTPSVTVSGTLTSNDLGIVPGGSYSVTVTQPAASTGTITVNPATGQYTFVPNPAFSGTAQTTYTICNTSVNPVICSNNTIIIQAGTTPVAVADFSTTVINTPISGTVATNDSGVLPAMNPVFTASQPSPGTGTLTMNPSTGQYTFTPASGFTGTTSATYTVCNVLSPPCSTTTITFSVYPAIVANPDVLNTTPSVTATGTLLSNDNGIVNSSTLSANYTVTVTQPASTTGTITVNPATGQYTFIPNPAFAGTAQTTYTVCNTSVNPTICSNSTITINVKPNPVPVNDATTTVINTTVSGNAAANDTGTITGTYSITGQPSGGTVSINPATGQYTFTPSPTFTGVTTATYNLCNGAPVTCSNAVITITVYPNLVANNDVVNTNTATPATGTLLSNDAGIVPGATYSVSLTQPSASVGNFTINPATGQYTFVPNPSFTGTASTTYTVCNTSVNPQICSTATININVFPNPAPVNDATTTVINTSVVANASTNDGGTTGGTYSITGQPGGGTVTIDPATGQYTFVPSPTFTGVTTATYNLCNGAPVTCSNAIITITVYPALVANNDVLVTSPTSTGSTGSLLGNDLGILPGGNYSVTTSQPASGTGTIIVDPATGNYTFVPNPNFTGTTSVTYTVCNNSVNPVICSTATLIISVGSPPLAADDATVTIVNTPVSGSVAGNDTNLSSAVFTGSQPTSGTGTLTMNPATGQYTFTPAPGFTGTTSATYTLCNSVSPPCATATIIFTVYPALQAVNDNTITGINTTVNGSLISNDNGIVSSGIYSVTVSQPSGNSGTITVNPTTGQYTYTPATGYTGTMVTTYTICQYNGTVQLQCSTATLSIVVGAKSSIGLAKALSGTIYNSDGSISQTYKIVVKNTGNQPLTSVAVVDNLSATYPSPSTFTITNGPAIPGAASSQLALDNTFTGKTSNTVITLPLTSSLAVGKTDTIVFTVKVAPNGFVGSYNNSASVTATGSGTNVIDVSSNGLDPDPDNDGDPTNNGSATTFTVGTVKIGVAKSVSFIEKNGTCNTVAFKFTVKNYGSNTIYNVSLTDNLDNVFSSPATYSVISTPSCVNGIMKPNANYTGSGGNTNLLLSTSTLAAGAVDTVVVKVKYCVTGQASYSNVAVAGANSLPGGGFGGIDVSTNGNNPDPGGNSNPSDPGEDVPTVFSPELEIFVPQGFSPNNDGINDVLNVRGVENYPNNELSILNRWGNVVYKKKVYDNTWDGTANQGVSYGDNKLPEGTYFYIMDLGDGQKPLKGYIYLNRAQK